MPYKTPIPGNPELINSITVGEDITSLNDVKGAVTFFAEIYNKSINVIATGYSKLYNLIISKEKENNLLENIISSNSLDLDGYDIALDDLRRKFDEAASETSGIGEAITHRL